MPRVNIYIRNDDWEAWNNISDKPEWIHDGLSTMGDFSGPLKVLPPIQVGASVSGSGSAETEVSKGRPRLTEQQPTTCKEGHLLGRNGKCLQKGCKYS